LAAKADRLRGLYCFVPPIYLLALSSPLVDFAQAFANGMLKNGGGMELKEKKLEPEIYRS
jgi:hypothetical protein